MTTNNDIFEEILESGPCPSTIRLVLTKLMDQGHYSLVIKHGSRALRHDPHDLELMKIMAEAYQKAGFLGQAEDMLERACSWIDQFSVLFKDLAKLYANRNHNDKATAFLKKYLSHHPQDSEAVQLLDLLEKSEEPAETQEPESAFPQEPPTLQDLATPTLAEIYFNQGQLQEAIEIYESVVARHPDDFEAARRLEELKAMVHMPQQPEQEIEQFALRESLNDRKEKMIAVLASWLGKMQEMNRVL